MVITSITLLRWIVDAGQKERKKKEGGREKNRGEEGRERR